MAQKTTGLFLGTTPLFDLDNLEDPKQSRELIIRLTQKINEIIIALNLKDTGYYYLTPFVNGQAYFPNPALTAKTSQQPVRRQVFRQVVNFGALPNTALKSVPHGLTPTTNWSFTRIYATASDPVNLVYFPIPNHFVGTGNQSDIDVDAVNVNIQTNYDASAFTICYVVLEYLQN